MKNSNYIINGILLVAVIVLFILQFTGKGTGVKSPETAFLSSDSAGFYLPIAYVQTDSILTNYKLAIDFNDVMEKTVADKSSGIAQKRNKLEKDVTEFQRKRDNNLFLTQDIFQNEYNRLMRQQKDLEDFTVNVERELSLEQQRISKQLIDSITSAIKMYNTPKKYEMILTNIGTDNILYADPSYDITHDFTEFLNARYVPEKK